MSRALAAWPSATETCPPQVDYILISVADVPTELNPNEVSEIRCGERKAPLSLSFARIL